jgi:regulator of cell morphogenesis and NO signaling
MTELDISTKTIGEIVAHDYRAASIFKEAGIDFCCGGKMSIEKTCREKGINPTTLLENIQKLESIPNTTTHNFNDWELGFLCDYIVNTHHKFVLKTLPDLVQYTAKISTVHGDRHPELKAVETLFAQINKELLQHLKNEEEVLFPAIKVALKNSAPDQKRLIQTEISRMSGEHEFAGGAMDKINDLTKNYLIPADSCNTYQVTLKLLQQFEDDLHTHVHLENNILYPKALKI